MGRMLEEGKILYDTGEIEGRGGRKVSDGEGFVTLSSVEFPHLGADLCYSRVPSCMQSSRRDERQVRMGIENFRFSLFFL